MYDSTNDTKEHIKRVQQYVTEAAHDLTVRAAFHDSTKLSKAEKPYFDVATPKLAQLEYGSEAYFEALAELNVALKHHYLQNDHHPEFFATFELFGEDHREKVAEAKLVQEMNLLQIIEMLCDWKAASERHENGDIYKSIEQNADRFGYSDEFKQILKNTANYLNW